MDSADVQAAWKRLLASEFLEDAFDVDVADAELGPCM